MGFVAAIVAVLAQLYHHHARAPAFGFGKGLDIGPDALETGIAVILRGVDAGNGPDFRLVTGVDMLQRIRHLADRGADAHCVHGQS